MLDLYPRYACAQLLLGFTTEQKCRLHCDPTTLFHIAVPPSCACTSPVYIHLTLTETCHMTAGTVLERGGEAVQKG